MRLTLLIAVASLFAVAAYGAPIVCVLHSLYPSAMLMAVHRRATPPTSSKREHLTCVHVVSGFPPHNHLYHQPQLFERDVVENSTPPHCEEEPPSPQRRGSGNQSWRRGSGNQSWRRGTSSPSSCSKEQGSPSQSWRRRRGDLQFEQRETIAEIE